VPPDGTRVAAPDLDLMFLSSERATATGAAHVVSLGATVGSLKQLGPALKSGCNVQPLSSPLALNSSWVWRVDEVDARSGAVVRGAVWRFTVRPSAAPPPPPVVTTSPSARSAASMGLSVYAEVVVRVTA
jgi:hypothetical protein